MGALAQNRITIRRQVFGVLTCNNEPGTKSSSPINPELAFLTGCPLANWHRNLHRPSQKPPNLTKHHLTQIIDSISKCFTINKRNQTPKLDVAGFDPRLPLQFLKQAFSRRSKWQNQPTKNLKPVWLNWKSNRARDAVVAWNSASARRAASASTVSVAFL